MKEAIIRNVPLFASLPEDEVHFLAGMLKQRDFKEGEIIMREADKGDLFYILIEGQVEIIKAIGTSDERLLAVREAGSFIGEMSLFQKEGLRSASVRTASPVTMLEMTRAEFDALLHRQPFLAYDMVGVLSHRLHESENLTIRDLRKKNIQLTQAYQDLQSAQAQLIEKEKLEHELDLARKIQMSILPRNPPICERYLFDALIAPMEAVGGDFYDFIDLGENRIAVVAGDVSDHGVPAALFMAMTVTLLRAEAQRSSNPSEVLSRVNQQLLQTNDTNMFVTTVFGVIDCGTRQFKFARAGHELPIILNHKGELTQMSASQGMPLALFSDPVFDEQEFSLQEKATLILHTDGLTEAFNSENEPFGKARLHKSLQENLALKPSALCRKVYSLVHDYQEQIPQGDDITLLALQVI